MRGNRLLAWQPAWALFAAAAIWLTRHGLALDTDSAMRLAGVRDLLHGQAWFDTGQHRMNTPYGLPMHWSRLVDAPLALLMLVSEGFALRAWPLALFAGVLFLLARLAARWAGAPCRWCWAGASVRGDVRHLFARRHRSSRPATAADAGGVAGAGGTPPMLTAIGRGAGPGRGSGSLPYALVAICAACLWLRTAAKARLFGVTGESQALLLFFTAPAYRVRRPCATPIRCSMPGFCCWAGGWCGDQFLPRHRLLVLAGLGLVLLALAALINPGCFAGPYGGLDARMQRHLPGPHQ